MRLAAVNAQAMRLGVSVGLTLADARARLPGLLVHDHDSVADRDWLERLSNGCVRYTPMVATAPPDGLVLDISGCAHLFGDEAVLVEDVRERLDKLGMTVNHASAGTADAAHALARYGRAGDDEDAAINRLPVIALRLDAESELGLRRAGLKTVGTVANRPRSAIAERFGKEAVVALERMLGEAENPLDPRIFERAVRVERRFAEPITNREYALTVLGELAEEAGQILEDKARGGRRFEAVFFRSDGLAQRLRIETGLATRKAKAIMRLFEERLETLNDPLDPGFGFDMIQLTVPETEPLVAAQVNFEKKAENPRKIAELIDRLSTRLGRNRLQRFAPYDTHIPEQSQTVHPAIEATTPMVWPRPKAGEPPFRPLCLFDPPERIMVIAEVPDGPPHHFEWRHKNHRVIRHEGPERIASEWWRSRKDPLGTRRLTRDYYRIENADGHRYWVFRHGLYGREKATPDWYMHGQFA